MSFISLSHEVPEIYSINPKNSETKYLTDALEGSQDIAWTIKGSMLMGKDNKIYKFHPQADKKWQAIDIQSDIPVEGISRLVVSPDGTKLAVVVLE